MSSFRVRVGDYVRFRGGTTIERVHRVWQIDRGPHAGRWKAASYGDFAGTIAALEDFEPMPYAGPEMRRAQPPGRLCVEVAHGIDRDPMAKEWSGRGRR